MKIAVFEKSGWEAEYLRENLKRNDLKLFSHQLDKKNVEKIKDAEGIFVFIYSKINKEVLEKLPKLKFIATMSTGFDHIDLEYCKSRGIVVCNVPLYGENTVAEHTFGLILALARKIVPAVDQTKIDNFSIKGLMGFDLNGKTLGVIGPGHIGQHVIKMAHGFNMKVIAYSPIEDKKIAKEFDFEYKTLEELLKNSDIVTMHAPLNDKTKHMINMKNIKLFKKGAFLVNTARGALIETKALAHALDKKIISGAALDVLEGEGDIKEEIQLVKNENLKREDIENFITNHILLKKRDVIITPHIAFFTREALTRILDSTLDNFNSFCMKKFKNKVS